MSDSDDSTPQATAPVLTYAAPAHTPGMLAVTFWLNLGCAILIITGMALALWWLNIGMPRRFPAFRASNPLRSNLIALTETLAWAGISIFCAWSIRRRVYRRTAKWLSLVLTLCVPIGTIVGLLTFIVLGSPTIRAAYERHE